MTRAEIDDWADLTDVELLTCDGMDDAILGIGQRFTDYFVVYDRARVIAKLMADGMTDEDAEEWFSFNIVGGWLGPGTPCFVEMA